MLGTLAMDDPPLQLERRSFLIVKRNVASLTDQRVVAFKIRQSPAIIRPLMTRLKNHSRFRRIVPAQTRTPERKAILGPQNAGQLRKEADRAMVIIRPPHFGLDRADPIPVKLPQIVRARDRQADRDPDRDRRERGGKPPRPEPRRPQLCWRNNYFHSQILELVLPAASTSNSNTPAIPFNRASLVEVVV